MIDGGDARQWRVAINQVAYRAGILVNINAVPSRSIRRNSPRVMRFPESDRIDLGGSPSIPCNPGLISSQCSAGGWMCVLYSTYVDALC